MDEVFWPLIQERQEQEDRKHLEEYNFKEGLLFFRDRLYILASLRLHFLKEAHESPLIAHLGYQKMFATLKQNLLWPRMKKDALEFTQQCLVCQKVKAEQVKTPRKL